MASRKYDRLSLEAFGRYLLVSGDLDPVYTALHVFALPAEQRNRWLLAYWSFYHAGLASYLSEFRGVAFGCSSLTAAGNLKDVPAPTGVGQENGGWPRGKERRHFRGQQGIDSAQELRDRFPVPESAVGYLVRKGDPTPLQFSTVAERVREWRGFGPWISYKIGDMLDRCGIHPVEYSFADAMYDSPRKCALAIWKQRKGIPQQSIIDNEDAAVREVVEDLLVKFSGYKAPPLNDRPVGLT